MIYFFVVSDARFFFIVAFLFEDARSRLYWNKQLIWHCRRIDNPVISSSTGPIECWKLHHISEQGNWMWCPKLWDLRSEIPPCITLTDIADERNWIKPVKTAELIYLFCLISEYATSYMSTWRHQSIPFDLMVFYVCKLLSLSEKPEGCAVKQDTN